MSSTPSPGSVVHRAPKASAATAGGHRKPRTRRGGRPAHPSTGKLTIDIVAASIRDASLNGSAPATDRVFDVSIRPVGRGRSKAKVRRRQGATVGPLSLPPGTYRIDVTEHVSAGVFQKYPEGACEAVIHPGRSTLAIAVLATDTLREVAETFAARIGVLVTDDDTPDAARMSTIQSEFNLATICLPWESVHPTTPDASAPPLSAPLTAALDGPALHAALAANGWNVDRFEPLIAQVIATGLPILPSPLTWFTTGQIPAWLTAHVHPSPHALVADHARALVRWIEKLGAPVSAWVAVNELEDTRDTELWGGLPDRSHASVGDRLAEMAKGYLEIVHAEVPAALLVVNDFEHELYPPAVGGRALAAQNPRAAPFHRTMRILLKTPALRGRLAAGYQMHFPHAKDWLARPRLYRAALARGIARLRRLGAPAIITEMALSIRSILDGRLSAKFKEEPRKKDLSPGSPWSKWNQERNALYHAHGYASTPGAGVWREQARVFRDIVGTYLCEPGCDTLVFWRMIDQPGDDLEDIYGHLFDLASTAKGYPRKPAYFGVLNGIIDAAHRLRGHTAVPNWLRRWYPAS